jgi:hypothetical protein
MNKTVLLLLGVGAAFLVIILISKRQNASIPLAGGALPVSGPAYGPQATINSIEGAVNGGLSALGSILQGASRYIGGNPSSGSGVAGSGSGGASGASNQSTGNPAQYTYTDEDGNVVGSSTSGTVPGSNTSAGPVISGGYQNDYVPSLSGVNQSGVYLVNNEYAGQDLSTLQDIGLADAPSYIQPTNVDVGTFQDE